MRNLKSSVHFLKFLQICILVFVCTSFYYIYLNYGELYKYLDSDVELESSTSEIASNSIEGNQNFEDIRKSLYSMRQREAVQQIKNELREVHAESIIEAMRTELGQSYESLITDMIMKELENEILNRSTIDPSHRSAYFDQVVNDLHAHNPKDVTINVKTRPLTYFRYKWIVPFGSYTMDFLKDFLDTTKSKINIVKAKHKSAITLIKSLKFPEKVFEGHGIVINGGGEYFPNSVIAIRNLREIGSQLPIELIIDTPQQYDKTICESLLPKLNAKCVIISDVLGEENYKKLDLKGYELKIMGLFVSSFENVIMLDSDNLPIKSPDYLFISKPFLKHKCIMWPDLWHRATGPAYYEIADIKLGEPVRRNFAYPWSSWSNRNEAVLADLDGAIPDETIELGELVISKREHYLPLLLSVYYNMNGNSMYYNLLCEGTYGEGDKETLAASFHFFKSNYYLVHQTPQRIGLSKGSMIQYDAEQDYDYYEFVYKWLQDNGIDTRINIGMYEEKVQFIMEQIKELNPYPEPEMFAIHVQRPKINPIKNSLNPKDYMTYGHESRKMGYHEDDYNNFFKLNDYELKFYRYSQWYACEADLGDEYWKDKNRDSVCEKVAKHVKFLINTSNSPDMQNLKDLGV